MFEVGQKVRAKIDMTNDLREDGMGVEHCASKGDELIVRGVTDYGSFAVSHEHITDRAFIATADELEAVARCRSRVRSGLGKVTAPID